MTPGDTLQDRPERATRTIRGLCTTETRTTPTSWVGQQSQCRAERSGKGEGGAPCYGPERRPRHGRQRAFAPRVVAPHAGDGHRTPSEGRGWRVSSPWDSGGGGGTLPATRRQSAPGRRRRVCPPRLVGRDDDTPAWSRLRENPAHPATSGQSDFKHSRGPYRPPRREQRRGAGGYFRQRRTPAGLVPNTGNTAKKP